MKTVKIDLSRDSKFYNIVPIADLHIGDAQFDVKGLKEMLDSCDGENTLYILNGDLINNATKSSVSDIYSSTMSPMEQLNTLIDIFEPYKEKIIGIVGGNHEVRTYRNDGIDISRLFARQLGLEDKYSSEGLLIFLRFGTQTSGQKETNGSGKVRKVCYTIYTTHGSGGGRSVGGKANALEQLSSIVDADIYIHSHTHLPMLFKQNFFRTDVRNSTVNEVDKLFVNTSACLNYGGYAEVAKYTPATRTVTAIVLDGERKKFSGVLM